MKKNLINIGINAKKASKIKIDSKTKNKVLKNYLQLIDKNKKIILRENNKDIKFALKNNLQQNLISRLTLNQNKLELTDYSRNTRSKIKRGLKNCVVKRVNKLIIASDLDSFRENILNNKTGYLFKNNDIDSLKNIIIN